MKPISAAVIELLLLSLSLTLFSSAFSDPVLITIESPEDWVRHGFTCLDTPTSNCTLKQINNASQIPYYFPESWRQLPFPYMVVEGLGSNDYYEALIPVQDARILKFEAEYVSQGESLGWKHYNIVQGRWFPAAVPVGSQWRRAVSEHAVLLNNGLRAHGFAFRNNRNTIFAAFRRITMIVDPEPQVRITINRVEDFEQEQVHCVGPECTFQSVANASLLPSYFPASYRALPTQFGSRLMYLDSSRPEFTPPIYYLQQNQAWRFLSTTNGVIQWDAEYYTEQERVFGWGPSQPNIIWHNFERSRTSSQWTDTLEERPYTLGLRYALDGGMLTPIGFFAFNNRQSEFVVFRKLEIKIFCEPGDIIGRPTDPPTTTTTTTTTTTSTTSTTTRPTTTTRTTTSTARTTTLRSSTTTEPSSGIAVRPPSGAAAASFAILAVAAATFCMRFSI